jgi:hypothetical protein
MAAEFKIGRLRFTWLGTWAPSTFYNRDAVVNYQGKTYVCLTPNTSSANFYTDYNNKYWNLVIDGKTFVGRWTPSTQYSLGNIAVYGGVAYYCTTANSDATFDSTKWNTYTYSWRYNNAWTSNTSYGIGDIVSYGGIVYACSTIHTSAATAALGLEANQSSWTIVDNGIYYTGIWTSNTRYRVNDLVQEGANVYSCTTYHTSTTTFDSTKWTMWIPGQEYKGTWGGSIYYQVGDIVTYGGNNYVNNTINNTNNVPSLDNVDWTLLLTNYELKGDWISTTQYKVSDLVRRNGIVYTSVSDNISQDPAFTSISKIYTASGSGGKTLKVAAIGGSGTATSGLVVGMVLTGNGFTLGQSVVSIVDATTITISRAPDSTPVDGETIGFVGVNSSYWTITIPSSAWQNFWQSGVSYEPGDLVVWQNATYKCINQNISTSLNRPDLDLTNSYWIYYILHARKNALNTYGDIETYTTGPGYASIPIGTQSYPLRSTNNLPTWQNINVTPNVFYVAPNGTDSSGYGTTWDKPFKTIKYACNYVSSGTQYQNTYTLIQTNKAWAVAEMYQWMVYQVTNNISPFSLSSVFDSTKTQRDANFVIDAVAYDITRGGNSQTVAATLSYFAFGSSNTFFNTAVANEMPYFIAALNYLQTLINACINNSTGSIQSYQVLNGVQSPISFVTSQLVSEVGAVSYVDGLLNIIITALTTQSTGVVPVPNTGISSTIMIKTGTYAESLPITVAENVALVGDELRGVVIEPAAIINTIATASTTGSNTITVNSTVGMSANTPVQFSTNIGGLTSGVTYYVIGSSITATQFSVASISGSTMSVYITPSINQTTVVYGGDALKNMFYMRNGSGLRNVTLTGLLGFLGPLNAYQTQRPTGSAYVSLDPGTGPGDTKTWIFRRSPYVQNVTTFGVGCIGLKIDGTLHNGGSKSIVANDFTHILSDGIGSWVYGPDAKSELISVFTYYNYAGYVAEAGGRIRAANGNSSYGTYGVIAEGYDVTETPDNGIIFNQSTQVQASVQSSFGANAQLLRLQFANAGSNYNTTTTNMIQYSNAFTTSPWTTDGNVSFTQTQAAPTGYAEAWTLTGTNGTINTSYASQTINILPAGQVYTNLTGYNVSGSGSGAQFNVTVTSTAYVVVVSNSGGSGYVVGNQILITGGQLGGANSINDCLLTVSGLSGSSVITVTVSGTVPTGSNLGYTVSIYAQQGTGTNFDLQAIFGGNTTVTSGVNFNFSTGSISPYSQNGGYIPISYGKVTLTNGWYRLYFTTYDITGLNNTLSFTLFPKGQNGTAGTFNYFYGSQVQISTSPTFYLETTSNQFTSYANYEVTGSGTGAVIIGDELRSFSVFQSRVSSDSNGVTGGASYLTSSNNAQGGTNQYVILAPQDVNTSSNYIGMRLFINSGTGAGQYGYIGTYNSTSKVAQILKESFTTLNVGSTTTSTNILTLSTGNTNTLYVGLPILLIPTYYTTVVTSVSQTTATATATSGSTVNTVTVSSTAQMAANMAVTFSGASFGNITTGYTYYINTIVNQTTIQLSTSLFGAVWGLTTATGSMTMTFTANTGYLTSVLSNSNGTTNMVPNYPVQFTGTAIGGVTAGTTYYINDIIDTQTFTISSNLVTVSASATSSSTNAITVATGTASNLTPLNPIIFTTTVMGGIVDSQKYFISKIVDSSNFQISQTILTQQITTTQATTNLITTTSTTGFVPNNPIIFTGTTFGGITAEQIYYILAVNDSFTFTISTTPGGSAVSLSTATGLIIMRTAPASFTLTDTTGTMAGTSTSQKLLLSSAAGSMNATFSTFLFGGAASGQLYYINTIPSPTTFTLTTVQYSGVQAPFTTKTGSMNVAAVGFDHVIPGTAIQSTLDYTTVYYIEPRTIFSAPPFTQTSASSVVPLAVGSSYSKIAYGNNYWIALPNANATAAGSSDGSNWSSITLPASASWSSIVYGNGYWVAVANASSTVIRSVSNGVGWRSTTLPFSANWNKNVYGNGVFAAMASDNPLIAYSTNYGGAWTIANLPSDRTVTAVNPTTGIVISTTQAKFGNSSLGLLGTGYLTLPTASTDFAFGTNDFTIEAWVYRSGNSGVNQMIIDFRSQLAQVVPTLFLNTSYIPTCLVNNTNVIVGSAAVPLSTWTHIAVSRVSGTTSMYVNGSLSGSAYTDSNNYVQAANGPAIGANFAGASIFNGYIDELRVSNGIGRYTSNFTPAVAPFTTDTYTELLMHFENINNSVAFSTTTGTWASIAYGAGRFVAVESGTASAAYSTNNGSTWTQSTLPVSAAWSSISFGNGRFVAVSSSSSTVAAYSFDGITWYSSSQSVQASQVTYGQGVFLAVNSGNALAYTSESGLDWIQQTISAKDFGATGNGTTDDTAALQSAINAAQGKTILLPRLQNCLFIIKTKKISSI